MGKAKASISIEGFEELKARLDQIGGEATKNAVEDALKASQQYVANQAKIAMEPHNKTGSTSKSIIKDGVVRWIGDTAEIGVGFDIDNGGLPSIFLMYGTNLYGQPHVTPDRNLYNAVYGSKTQKQVRQIQEEVFHKALERMAKK